MKKTSLIALFVFIFWIMNGFALASSQRSILGQVAVSGKARIFVDGRWEVIDRLYPVIGGSHFKSEEGGLSFLFTDGTRLEVGDHTEIFLEGARGDYRIELKKGKITFRVPEDARMVIEGSGLKAEINNTGGDIYRVESREVITIGGMMDDGKRARVVTMVGNIVVRTSSGTIMTVSEGKAIEYSRDSGKIRPLPVQAVGAEALEESYEGLNQFLFFMVSGAGVGGFMNELTSERRPVSPSVP